MKRGSIEHPKMIRLAKLLDVERWGAVGIMESLWHFASRHAMQGNIGKWSDEEIASAVAWSGEASVLISALVSSGWLDRSKRHRLLIHDWKDHADDAVRKTLRNRKQEIITEQNISEKFRKIRNFSGNGSPQPSLAEPSLAEGCSEPSAGSEPPVSPLPFFPCNGEGSKEWYLSPAKLAEYVESFPGVDVLADCRRALQWCRDNPEKRKTPKGMPAFLSRWLTKTQNAVGGTASPTAKRKEPKLQPLFIPPRKSANVQDISPVVKTASGDSSAPGVPGPDLPPPANPRQAGTDGADTAGCTAGGTPK
jgi:hypothetical protein